MDHGRKNHYVNEDFLIEGNLMFVLFLNSTGKTVIISRCNIRGHELERVRIPRKTAVELITARNSKWQAYIEETNVNVWISGSFSYTPELLEKDHLIDHPSGIPRPVLLHLVRITQAMPTLQTACLEVLGRSVQNPTKVKTLQLPKKLQCDLERHMKKQLCDISRYDGRNSMNPKPVCFPSKSGLKDMEPLVL